MKKKLLLLALIAMSCSGPKQKEATQEKGSLPKEMNQQGKLEKKEALAVEKLIKKAASVGKTVKAEPLGQLDSLFTSPLDDERFKEIAQRVEKAREKAELYNWDIAKDVTPFLKKMEKDPELYGRDIINKTKAFQAEQQKLIGGPNRFVPKFIGYMRMYKCVFTRPNVPKDKEQIIEFYFDKDITGVVKIRAFGETEYEIID